MKKWLLILSTCLLVGCWDVDEPERMLYIYGLGMDYKDDEYIIHAQIIDFSNIAKSEQPTNPDAIQAEVGTAKGITPSEAFYNLYQAIDEQLFWGHFTFMVFSEEALKEGRANLLINTFIRFHETRYNTWVYSTKDDIKEIMLTTPILNKAISLSKLADPLNSYKQDSFIEPINFRKMIIHFNEPNHEVNIPLASIYKGWETTKTKDTSAKVDGVAIVTPTEFKGFLKDENAQGLQWVSNSTKRSSFTYKGETKEDTVSIIIEHKKASIHADVSTGDPLFTIKVTVEAIMSGFEKNLTVNQIKDIVKKQIEKEIRLTYEEALKLDADVYRLSEHLYRNELKTWKKFEKKGAIPLTNESLKEITINVNKVHGGRKTYEETIK